jgi:SAM-dependent methyltransferase
MSEDPSTEREPETDSEYWARYYAVTVDRPAWATVRKAIELFADDGPGAADSAEYRPRLAVDLGCGGGRDSRELLRAGWQVLAMDREPAALEVLGGAAGAALGRRLETRVGDFATFEVPPCDLVNASLCLPFVERDAFDGIWARIVAALSPGGRFSAMVFGERDGSAGEAGMTCLPAGEFRSMLDGFDIEYWSDTEDDKPTALGEPHHFHLIEFVARKLA